MAKSDFCFTYYDGDAARDMAHMSRIERGAYTDIIISQRKFGHLSKDQIKKILGRDFDECWGAIELILKTDEAGNFFIEWLEKSEIKAKKHSKKQSDNVTKRYQNSTNTLPKNNLVTPLEDGDGNEDGFENEFEEESVRETKIVPRESNVDDQFQEYEVWTKSITEKNDHLFEQMLIGDGVKPNGQLTTLARDHLGLLARYERMRPATQQLFRYSLLKYIKEQLNNNHEAKRNHNHTRKTEPAKDWGKLAP